MNDSSECKWIILFRKDQLSRWEIHAHHDSKTPYRFKVPENAYTEVKRRRRNGQIANAVREDKLSLYGVVLDA
jgi:hypothetical protein